MWSVVMWSELTWFMWSDFVLKWSEVKWCGGNGRDLCEVILFRSEVKWSEMKWSDVMWSKRTWFMWSDFVLKWSKVMWSERTWFMSSVFLSEVKWCVMEWTDVIYVKWFCFEVKWSGVTVKLFGTKISCTLGWPYTECTWLYFDHFIWCMSCTVIV